MEPSAHLGDLVKECKVGDVADGLGEALQEEEEADFTAPDAARGSDSESSDDGMLPPLDAYWSSMLNVSATADPLPAPKMLSKAELERESRGKSRGGKGKGHGKFAPHPLGPMFYMGGHMVPGTKGGWKGGKRMATIRANDIGDFVAWAKDPAAEDGSRGERSRSPHRQREAEGLESFMSWARSDRGVKEEPTPDEPDDLHTFLAWASRGDSTAPLGEEQLSRQHHTEETRETEVQATRAAISDATSQPKVEVAPPEPVLEQSLVVPKELEEELRAMGTGSKREERDSDEE